MRAGEALGVAERISQPSGVGLARVQKLEPGAGWRPPLGSVRPVKLWIVVKMVLDRPLAPPGDEQHAPDAGPAQLLDHVLHDRLVDYREHLLRRRPRGGQQARAQPGGRDDGVGDQATSRAALCAGVRRAEP